MDNLDAYDESPLKAPTQLNGTTKSEGFEEWYASNVRLQSQPGYAFVTITLPLGDITADQTRALADISRKYVKDTIRATVEQNIVLRWVTMTDLPALYRELKEIGLGDPGAESMVDINGLPRYGLLQNSVFLLRVVWQHTCEAISLKPVCRMRLRTSVLRLAGCPNSCGQHHIANIGFFGSSLRVGGHIAPVYLVLLGGHMVQNANSYGLAHWKKFTPIIFRRSLKN